ncbi:MAG: iron chelate uptake ABC transporter family permease subunit [Nocardioides sp.]|uniref:FecCD family ABC transporter permease n=1 Tax=Nocardioides sp. TaxID=35761 RepID=UPI0039E63943
MSRIVLRIGDVASWRLRPRSLLVLAALLSCCVAAAITELSVGAIQIAPGDVVRALVGDAGEIIEKVVVHWRLPRVTLGLLFGAALGLAGAVLQSLTRNPLGSPDIIGFDAGAYTGAVVSILVLQGSVGVIPSAVAGGTITAALVYVLAYKRGVQGFRLIVVGIAITSLAGAVNSYLILKANLFQAQMAALWGAGSLNGVAWSDVRTAVPSLALGVAILAWLGPRMRFLEMGDDAARALGIDAERTRVGLMLAGVTLSATVTAICGPIAFVSLAAPQIALRLTRAPGVQLLPSAVCGAALLVGCDVLGANAFGQILPVGLVTVSVGGVFLVLLLVAEAKKEIRWS